MWSFLLVLSGIVDIGIGFFVLAGVISIRGSASTVFIVCLTTGLFYFSLGIALALIKMRRQKN